MKPYWLSSIWLRLTARPFIRIDGAEIATKWGGARSVRVEAGDHLVAGGIRYPAFSRLMGARDVTVHVVDDKTVSFVVQNGLLNREPFLVKPVR